MINYLHTMVRIRDIDESYRFYCEGLGLIEVRRSDYENGRFTLIFLAAPGDIESAKNNKAPLLELTYNWDPEEYDGGRNFGHLAFGVDNIYDMCTHLEKIGIDILRPPRDGRMAFIKSPDGISIELLQKGNALEPREPWLSRENNGNW